MSDSARPFSRATVSSIALLVSLIGMDAYAADSFPQKLDRLLREHHLIRMVDADVMTADRQVAVEKSAYYPKFSMQAYTGREKIDRDVGTTGRFSPRETSAQINQLVTDFGATGSRVDAAKAVLEKEGFERNLQTQNLLLAAVEAQLKLIKARKTYQFARESEATVLKQTQLESARVEAGRGYATDVLQAKVQLAGAEARRVGANLQLAEAVNRYKAVFGEAPVPGDDLQGLALPESLLPGSEDALGESVVTQNPDTQAALARQRVARSDRKAQINKELMPRVDLVLSRSRANELDGIQGDKNDTRLLLRLNWSFDLGLRSVHLSDATQAAVTSATEKADYVLVQANEEARSAWANWQMSKERVGYLKNQVNISANFLTLARRERELGRRSLLDILNGDIGQINARSDALAAEIDERIAAFRVLRASGKLDVALFSQPGVLVDASGWGADVATSAVSAPEKPSETPSAPVAAVAATATSLANTDVQAFVEKWRAAWAARDVSAYLASYATDFSPAGGMTYEQWAAQRKQRITRAEKISLQLRNVRIETTPDGYSVEFDQRYSASQFADNTRKRLMLKTVEGKLLIAQELLLDSASPAAR